MRLNQKGDLKHFNFSQESNTNVENTERRDSTIKIKIEIVLVM